MPLPPAPPPAPGDTYTHAGHRPYQHDRLAVGAAPLPPPRGAPAGVRAPALPAAAAAVFDGHGSPATGGETAALCAHRFLPALAAHPMWSGAAAGAAACAPHARVEAALGGVLRQLEAAAVELSAAQQDYHGSTACAAVVVRGGGADGGTVVVTANVGDSRAVLGVGDWGGDGALRAVALTRDHVPTDAAERARIEAAGGWVTDKEMLNGYIGMSRALGDNDLKAHRNLTAFRGRPAACAGAFADTLLVATPDVSTHPVDAAAHFVVVASDGVWHVMDGAAAVAAVRRALAKNCPPAKALVLAALARGAADNITVAVLPVSGTVAALPAMRGAAAARADRRRSRFSRRAADAAPAAAPAPAPAPAPALAPAPAPRRAVPPTAPPARDARVAGAAEARQADADVRGSARARDGGGGRAPGAAPAAEGRRRLRDLPALWRLRNKGGKAGRRSADGTRLDDQTVHGRHGYGGPAALDDSSLHGGHAYGGPGAVDDHSVHGTHAYGSLAALADAERHEAAGGGK